MLFFSSTPSYILHLPTEASNNFRLFAVHPFLPSRRSLAIWFICCRFSLYSFHSVLTNRFWAFPFLLIHIFLLLLPSLPVCLGPFLLCFVPIYFSFIYLCSIGSCFSTSLMYSLLAMFIFVYLAIFHVVSFLQHSVYFYIFVFLPMSHHHILVLIL